MTLSDAIKERIIELLKEKDMNVGQLATKSGINASTVHSILKGKCKIPNSSTLYYICIGFGITLSDFYNSKLFDMDNINDD